MFATVTRNLRLPEPSLGAPSLHPLTERSRLLAPERRRALRKAAARLFAQRGFADVGIKRIAVEACLSLSAAQALYAGRDAVLADLMMEHLLALGAAVSAAQDAHAAGPPEALLESLLRAWLDTVAAEADEHRTFLLAAHLPPEAQRRALRLRHRVVIEIIYAALAACVPDLVGRPGAAEPLFITIRTLLSDPWRWPIPTEPEPRRAEARRLAGMLIAAAEAEAAGHWPRLGHAAGPAPGRPPLQLDSRQARRRMREALDAAAEGVDVALTRRGRIVARLVGVGSSCPGSLPLRE